MRNKMSRKTMHTEMRSTYLDRVLAQLYGYNWTLVDNNRFDKYK